ncbi:MAG: DUF1501 domain-containing protein, partial [Fuerstiella sp.]|nr:DUF1501 domain-containing protein [Fuerstiella sp.]
MNIDRRTMLHESALGFGSLALTSLMSDEGVAGDQRMLTAPAAHHTPTANSIIFLFMSGGPGQTDTFDPKPALEELDGLRVPDSIVSTIP